MIEKIKKFSKMCKCENCGNEAEMVVTCSMESPDIESKMESTADVANPSAYGKQLKGTGTCSHCGNEAEIWVDM